MTIKELRNLIVSGLSGYLGIPVALANQVNPEPEFPFVIYSFTAAYIPENGLGDYSDIEREDRFQEIRKEEPTCTMSFTVCSVDRKTKEGVILGDDEALELAEKATGWFLHVGYEDLSRRGATVVDVSNIQDRSTLMVDEEARRQGFDVTIRYVRQDAREIQAIDREKLMIKEGDAQ